MTATEPRAELALDFGKAMGWALRLPDRRIESGMRSLVRERGESDGARFRRFKDWLHVTKARIDAIERDALQLVTFERVDFIMPNQAWSAHDWGAYWGLLLAWCEHHRIPYVGVAPSTLKKRATGHGFAKKPAVVAAVNQRMAAIAPTSAVITDHNEADALALLIFCGDLHGLAGHSRTARLPSVA